MDRKRGHLSAKVALASDAPRLNILTIGDPGVGKSCLVKKYCENKFTPEYISTIGIDYGLKTVDMDFSIVKVNFWDTAGDAVYHEIRKEFYKDVHGVLLVFDGTDRLSFLKTEKWIKELQGHLSKGTVFAVVGNKVENESESSVSSADAEEFKREQAMATGLEFSYHETSAKTRENIKEIMEELFSNCLWSIRQTEKDSRPNKP